MAKRLLNGDAGDLVQPRMLLCFLQRGKRGRRLMIPNAFLSLHPRIGAQAEHVVVDKTRTAKRPGEDLLLLGRWVEPESVGAFDVHLPILSISCKDSQPNRRMREMGHAARVALSLPGMSARVSRATR